MIDNTLARQTQVRIGESEAFVPRVQLCCQNPGRGRVLLWP